MKFDELHKLQRFFATMEISDAEKKKRCDFAYLLYDAIYYTFALIKVEKKVDSLGDILTYRDTLEDRITDVFEQEGIPYEEGYIPRLATEIIETTDRHPDDPYYVSQDRALLIAQNESNTAYNHTDYETARANGKKYKTWITEGDSKVREAHVEVDMVRIPINEKFRVGNDEMRYPHDYLNGSAENLVNCRCTCVYE